MDDIMKKLNTLIEEENKLEKKIDIYKVPLFPKEIERFETNKFKSLIIEALEAAPLQFWIMPAAMRKNIHHDSEHGIGEVVYDEINKINLVKSIGGKAFHTLRVLDVAEIMMEADDLRVMDFMKRKVIAQKPGNEFTKEERDIIRAACLLHDIYSGGTEDEFNPKRRGMDSYHPHYHRSELSSLCRLISLDEWELLLDCIENHMWKWDKHKDPIKFHDIKSTASVEEAHKFANRYRMVKIVELSDLIASRQIRE